MKDYEPVWEWLDTSYLYNILLNQFGLLLNLITVINHIYLCLIISSYFLFGCLKLSHFKKHFLDCSFKYIALKFLISYYFNRNLKTIQKDSL